MVGGLGSSAIVFVIMIVLVCCVAVGVYSL